MKIVIILKIFIKNNYNLKRWYFLKLKKSFFLLLLFILEKKFINFFYYSIYIQK